MALSASAASIWRTARSSAALAAVPAMPAATKAVGTRLCGCRHCTAARQTRIVSYD